MRVNIAAPGLADTEQGLPGAAVPTDGVSATSGACFAGDGSSGPCCARPAGEGPVGNEADDAQREVRVLVCYLLGGAGAVVAEPAGDAEAHLRG